MMNTFFFSFWIFEFSVSYILVLLGFLASSWVAIRTIHEKQLSLRFLSDHMLLYTLGALFFGRLGVFISLYPTIEEKMIYATSFVEKSTSFLVGFLSFWQGGFDIFWAFGGFFILFLFYCSLKREQPLSWLDAFALPTILFFIFFSIASFFAGWRYGSPVSENAWFKVQYDLKEVLYSGPIHPVQLYSAFAFLILLIIGGILWERKIKHSWPRGIYGGIMLSFSFFLTAFLELFRGDLGKKYFDIIPFSFLVFFGFGLSLLVFMIWKGHFHVFSRFKSIIIER